ncbi:glycine-rich RNA-binding protein isoform X2 [Nematostella vectensis]|uniref:glycine-rich RNA-binding protein isoform X2 n=1 Tax=Nematostella vectensis TaxID=45351 RepID=UPI00138FCAD4|nr:glycine-rich RNA-binding protein isoform X2 [Nematostella vectensis]
MESLTEHFKQYGQILSSKVMFDLKSGRSKKYGFVFFKDEEACEKAMGNQPHFIEGQKVFVELMTTPPAGSSESRNPRRNRQNER